MKKIVMTLLMDESALAYLSASLDFIYDPTRVVDTKRPIAELSNADTFIILNRTQAQDDFLVAHAQANVVSRFDEGLLNIDVAGCHLQDIQAVLTNGSNALDAEKCAISTVAFLLPGNYLSSEKIASCWRLRLILSNGQEISCNCLGLLHFDSIDQFTTKLAQCLGVLVTEHDPILPKDHSACKRSNVHSASMEHLIAQSDVMSLYVPLKPATSNLMSKEHIAQMQPGACVINAFRKGIGKMQWASRPYTTDTLRMQPSKCLSPPPLVTVQPSQAALMSFSHRTLPASPPNQMCASSP